MKQQVICLLVCLFFAFSFSALHAQEKATPKRGEGITTFLERNNRPGRQYYQEFMELNKQKLGKSKTLQLGITYQLPPLRKKAQAKPAASSKTTTKPGKTASADKSKPATPVSDDMLTADQVEELPDTPVAEEVEEAVAPSQRRVSPSRVHEPLFGKALADVKVTSKRLSGACFYIVSGHGGPDPGAIGKVGNVELHEDEYAYDIALRLARDLMQEGAEVRIIIQDAKDGIRDEFYLKNSKRETCMGSAIPLNQVQRLKQRCSKINTLYSQDKKRYKYCRAIFIHLDSRSKKQQTDVFFYHSMNSASSKKLAYTMRDTFEAKYKRHQPGRGFSGTVSGRNLYVLANAQPTSVFVELGNIQNAFDQKRFVMSSNRQALANWLCDGFIADYRRK